MIKLIVKTRDGLFEALPADAGDGYWTEGSLFVFQKVDNEQAVLARLTGAFVDLPSVHVRNGGIVYNNPVLFREYWRVKNDQSQST